LTTRDDPPPERETGERPFPDSLCWRCAEHRVVRSARSVFVMCQALPVKYPRQPVTACPGFRQSSPGESRD
jgi:hypothetical protein